MAVSLNEKPTLNNWSDEDQVEDTWKAVVMSEFICCKHAEIIDHTAVIRLVKS
jgi:hypothetical protein